MKPILFTIAALVLNSCLNEPSKGHMTHVPLASTKDTLKHKHFKLYYSYFGLGSNMGSMQPTFKVSGENYIYKMEQNSYLGKPSKAPETVCSGKLRPTSIDSILNILKDINDTLIAKENNSILSGGIHNITIKHEDLNIKFQLQNTSDSTATKIIEILNSNIPKDKPKLWLFNS